MVMETLKKHPDCYYSTDNGVLLCGDCLEIMPGLEKNINLVVTSPPYGEIRDYNGYNFDFKGISQELFRVTNKTGVVVWVVKDSAENGSESGDSFRQALFFKDIGFNLTTMLYTKNGGLRTGSLKFYQDNFEYVFVLTKFDGHTFNPIKDKLNVCAGMTGIGGKREKDGSITNFNYTKIGKMGYRDNVWQYSTGFNLSTTDKIAFKHPAIFPEALALDHILSWSNEGDMVLDPMAGSGTTLKMAEKYNRKWIGVETSEKYCEIIAKRLEQETAQLKFF